MGLNATWSMAVGGMIGGGIFSVLGVVISIAGELFVASFILGGLVALATAWSYSRLVATYGEAGGAFMFLRHENLGRIAGALSWVLILGYTLTISVYAFTFSAYLSQAAGLSSIITSAASIGIIAALVAVNLVGVGQAAGVEIFSVWGKVAILAILGVVGLSRWDGGQLSTGSMGGGAAGAVVGASAVFMAYEGFQLLTYDYDDISRPRETLKQGLIAAVVSVVGIYVLVSLGAVMLSGADQIVKHKEVALAIAGEKAAGTFGMWAVTVAAVLSTASAINATLFATARLTGTVSEAGELPRFLGARNSRDVPARAVVTLGALAAVLAAVGGLSQLVEAASLTFLVTFATVNVIAFRRIERRRWIPLSGAVGATGAAAALMLRLARNEPVSLAAVAAVAAAAFLLRSSSGGE